ncbi:MAG: glycosyltransferase [Planctomycetes bacterium]|nr:glycosyltransferase [Planctomycetota bacterium]
MTSLMRQFVDLLARWRVCSVLAHASGRLLDIGCGTNDLVRSYRENGVGDGAVGVDVYPWPGGDLLVDDTSRLPFDDTSFDTVSILAALNHIPNREAVLREAWRLLKAEGRLLVTMIPPRISRVWHWLCRSVDPDQVERGMKPGEVYGFTRRQVRALLEDAGFEIEREIAFMLGVNTLTIARPRKPSARAPGLTQVTVVLPAHNEAERIGAVLKRLRRYACRCVVVDDGSEDGTAEVAAAHRAVVLRHAAKRGQGRALRTGLDFVLGRPLDESVVVLHAGGDQVPPLAPPSQGGESRPEVIVTMDADGQHDPNDLPALVEPILQGECDVALGSRFLGAAPGMPRRRRWLLKSALFFTRWTSGLRLTDTHNGFRAFSRAAAEKLHLTLDRMAYASQIFDQIRAHGLSFREVPVTVRYTKRILAKGQHAWGVIPILWDGLFAKLWRLRRPVHRPLPSRLPNVSRSGDRDTTLAINAEEQEVMCHAEHASGVHAY